VKNKKLILIPAVIVVLFVSLWAYFFWYPDFVMNQRIEELNHEGVNVEVVVYDVFYADATSTSPEAIFTKKLDWSAFNQEVMTAKESHCTVTVSVDRDARIFVFTCNETAYYYYKVT
jgi:hypothetical protein